MGERQSSVSFADSSFEKGACEHYIISIIQYERTAANESN